MPDEKGAARRLFLSDAHRARLYVVLSALAELGCLPEDAASRFARTCEGDASKVSDSRIVGVAAERLHEEIVRVRETGGTLAMAAKAAFGHLTPEEQVVLEQVRLLQCVSDRNYELDRIARACGLAARMIPNPTVG